MGTFFDPYFHFCWELAMETWAKGSSVGYLSHTHSLSELLFAGAVQPVNALPDWKLPILPKVELQTKVEERHLCPLKSKKESNGLTSANQGIFYMDPRQPPSEWHFMLKPLKQSHLLASHLFWQCKTLHQILTTDYMHATKVASLVRAGMEWWVGMRLLLLFLIFASFALRLLQECIGTPLNDHPWFTATLSMSDTHLGPNCIAIQNST